MNKEFIDRIFKITDMENVHLDEPMKSHTTFKIGGNADVYIDVAKDEISDIISLSDEENVPYTIIGNGSNILVGDKGIRGVTISIGKRMSDIKVDGTVIVAEAGALLSRTAATALDNSLSGMEFASGIPGSVGGAVLMNAGAYGGEMKDIIESVEVLTPKGVVEVRDASELDLSYRHSKLMETGGIVLRATFRLEQGNAEGIKATMQELNGRRVEKQPLNFPSAGSTFKRPEGYFAGKLIQDAGLRGYKVGGAMVSDKHCGFVVNTGGATASDVRNLIDDVSAKVYDDAKVKLEPEVRFIGEF